MPKLLEVRGEVIFPRKAFQSSTPSVSKPASRRSPIRAMPPPARCASSIRRSPPRARSNLSAIRPASIEGAAFKSQWDFLQGIKALGLRVNPLSRVCRNVEEVLEYWNELTEKRHELDYEADGVVAKVNSFALAGTARRGLALAAMGDCLQVQGAAGRDGGRED